MNPLSIFSGLWGYVAAAVVAAGLSAAGTYYVVHNADTVKFQAEQLTVATDNEAAALDSLNHLESIIATINVADNAYQSDKAAIDANFAAIQKELSNAFAKTLPTDCRPDAARLHALTAAVVAANAHSGVSK